MPAVVQHLSGLVDALRRRLGAARCGSRSTRRCRPTGSASPDPGKTPAELTPGGRRRRHHRAGVRDRGATGSSRPASGSGIRPRVAVRVNPDFEVKGSGMRMGGGPQQFGVDAEQVPGAARASSAGADVDLLGFHVFAGSQNLRAEILCEAQRKTVDLVAAARRARAGTACATSTSAAASASPTSTRTQPLDLAPIGDNLAELLDDAIRADAARGAGRHRARPLHRRRVRRLRHPGRRPQGVPRPDLPRRRRRAAPPARRVGQLRPGDPAQLPARGRQPRSTSEPAETGHRRRLPVHPARPAGRQRRAAARPSRRPRRASSRPAPTA